MSEEKRKKNVCFEVSEDCLNKIKCIAVALGISEEQVVENAITNLHKELSKEFKSIAEHVFRKEKEKYGDKK